MTSLARSLVTLVFAALPLLAQPAAGAPHPGPRGGRLARVLNLTEAQRTSIQAIRDKHQPDLASRREAMRQARTAFQAALKDPAASEAQLRALHEKTTGLQFEMLLARRSVHQEVQAVLTPEQRIKAAELRGAAQARRQERMRHLRQGMGMAG